MANAQSTASRLAARVPQSIVERIPAAIRVDLWDSLWEGLAWAQTPAKREVVRLRDHLRMRGLARAPAGGTPIAVQLKCLSCGPVPLRPGTSDAQVVFETFVGRYHLPPAGTHAATVWDLGTNLGLTVAHFAELWPQARITGLEPQPDLAATTANLVRAYGPRCTVIEAAVWTSDGSVSFAVDPGNEFGGHVDSGESGYTVPALSLNTLLEQTGPPDYVKMDIEGGEALVLRENTEWAQAVAMIKVECHLDYTVDDCTRDLEALGFKTRVEPQRDACVLGWRGTTPGPS